MSAPETGNEPSVTARANSDVNLFGQVDKRAQKILFDVYQYGHAQCSAYAVEHLGSELTRIGPRQIHP